MSRRWIGILAVIVSAGAVFGTDLAFFPSFLFPAAPYAIPILVAGFLLTPPLIVGTTVGVMALESFSAFYHGTPTESWALELAGLAIIGALATLLAVRTQRQVALAAERARLIESEHRARAEAEQRAAELDATFAAIPDAVVITAPNERIVRLNPRGEELLGYTAEDRGATLAERLARLGLKTAEGRPADPAHVPAARAFRGETSLGTVYSLQGPGGQETWVSTSAAPIRTPDGRLLGVAATYTDITALHNLQEQLADVLRSVSHDLRNPLAAIQGQAELLERALEQAAPPEREQHSVEAILTSARRMNSMIQDLVDSARVESGQLRLDRQPVDLRAFALDLKQRLAPSLDVGRIRVEIPEGLPPVLADPDRLERILTNLWSNALKYSAPGTAVTVSARQEDGRVITSVADRGPGIPPEDLPHLFERYFRARGTAAAHEGLGLGLYITRRLVEAHGGRIWAESEVDVGSTFSFSLHNAGTGS